MIFTVLLVIAAIIFLGIFLSHCGKVGTVILAIGAIFMAITGGWIGGIVWGYLAWKTYDKEST